ncbi:MAG: KEOPS complex subunit Pcc1 [Candidatus Bathyarchaeia archaeon]
MVDPIDEVEAVVRLRRLGDARAPVIKALMPEVHGPSTKRSRVELRSARGVLELKIKARDISAARASLSSYLHWVESVICVVAQLRRRGDR